MSLRILHVLDHSIPLHSGYTFRTLSLLREQRKRGWQTFHLTSPKQDSGSMTEEQVEKWHFYRTPAASPQPAIPGLAEIALVRQLELRLQDVALEVRPDVLHAHSPMLNAMAACRVGKRLGIPVVYEVRAFWEDAAVDHGTTHEGSLRYRLTRHLETRCLKRVAHVFTICEGLRGEIVSRGIPAGKVTVIPNAVDAETFELGGPPDQELLKQLGLTGRVVVGFIGSFYAYEGLDLLLDALGLLLKTRPEARVLLVGGGPQDAALKSQARRLGLQDKVVFTGRIGHEDVRRYYDLVDVLAYPRLPSRLTDLVTPLKPLEAMAQGRMMVASDVGGHRELIRDGETGFLFRAGDASALATAIDKLLAQRAHWPQVRERARRFVEAERTWADSVSRYAEPYRRALSAHGRSDAVGAGSAGVCSTGESAQVADRESGHA